MLSKEDRVNTEGYQSIKQVSTKIPFYLLKNLNCQIKGEPNSAGTARLMIHKKSDAAKIEEFAEEIVPKKQTATPALTAISVSAKVGIADVTKKVSAINENSTTGPPLIPKSLSAK